MRDPHKLRFVLVAALLVTACSQEHGRAANAEPPDVPSSTMVASDPAPVAGGAGNLGVSDPGVPNRPVASATAFDLVELRTGMTCVSSTLADPALVPQVLRADIAMQTDTVTVALTKGPQFRAHANDVDDVDDVMELPAEEDLREVVARGSGSELLLEGADGLRIQLRREGAVMRGSFVDVETQAVSLTCWNEQELFGAPWMGVPGMLPARFDWETGVCLDTDGLPALNPTPIEVVRETGWGECSDLRGVALNADDLSVPDLGGWQLMGAQLDGARLFFANLRFASLQGADLSGLEFGYASIDGSIDDNTTLPGEDQGCVVTRSPWGSDRVSCKR